MNSSWRWRNSVETCSDLNLQFIELFWRIFRKLFSITFNRTAQVLKPSITIIWVLALAWGIECSTSKCPPGTKFSSHKQTKWQWFSENSLVNGSPFYRLSTAACGLVPSLQLAKADSDKIHFGNFWTEIIILLTSLFVVTTSKNCFYFIVYLSSKTYKVFK